MTRSPDGNRVLEKDLVMSHDYDEFDDETPARPQIAPPPEDAVDPRPGRKRRRRAPSAETGAGESREASAAKTRTSPGKQDWGFEEEDEGGGISEWKLGTVLILVLMIGFGFVAWRKYDTIKALAKEKLESLSSNESVAEAGLNDSAVPSMGGPGPILDPPESPRTDGITTADSSRSVKDGADAMLASFGTDTTTLSNLDSRDEPVPPPADVEGWGPPKREPVDPTAITFDFGSSNAASKPPKSEPTLAAAKPANPFADLPPQQPEPASPIDSPEPNTLASGPGQTDPFAIEPLAPDPLATDPLVADQPLAPARQGANNPFEVKPLVTAAAADPLRPTSDTTTLEQASNNPFALDTPTGSAAEASPEQVEPVMPSVLPSQPMPIADSQFDLPAVDPLAPIASTGPTQPNLQKSTGPRSSGPSPTIQSPPTAAPDPFAFSPLSVNPLPPDELPFGPSPADSPRPAPSPAVGPSTTAPIATSLPTSPAPLNSVDPLFPKPSQPQSPAAASSVDPFAQRPVATAPASTLPAMDPFDPLGFDFLPPATESVPMTTQPEPSIGPRRVDTEIATKRYTVGDGENYWAISKKKYGTVRYFAALAVWNKNVVADPRNLRPGMSIELPPADLLEPLVKTANLPTVTPQAQNPIATLRPEAHTKRRHEVRTGESYWNISKSQYGTSRYFAALAEWNKKTVPDPRKLRAGTIIELPAAADLEPLVATSSPNGPAAPTSTDTGSDGLFKTANGEPRYRVGPNETLSEIALKMLGRSSRWRQIFALNTDVLRSPEIVPKGAILKLPADALQLAQQPSP